MRKFILSLVLVLGVLGNSFAESELYIKDSWVRGTPPGTDITALYMTIKNEGSEDDVLVGVSSDIAKAAEIHETVVDDQGVAKMNMLQSIEVPSGNSVELKPGGVHVMLIGIKAPLKSGEKVKVDLEFKGAGTVETEAMVMKPGTSSHDHH